MRDFVDVLELDDWLLCPYVLPLLDESLCDDAVVGGVQRALFSYSTF